MPNQKLQNIMDRMSSFQEECRLPPLPAYFRDARKGLDQTDFNVVVCGEVKKGKSSLLNAILGEDILPVGTLETTSQVFYISHAETHSYALVFEDGSRADITKEDVINYGTQTMANLRGEPLFKGTAADGTEYVKNLKWIEMNVPAPFLPKGIHLIDTPGLGAVYAYHGEITLRHIANADVAVYLLDSNTSVTEDDAKFIDRILHITHEILFVQSKIDTKQTLDSQGVPAWEIKNREHEETLQKKYGETLGEIRVFPVSSKWLQMAARDKNNVNQDVLARSRFEDFQNALLHSMEKVSGWYMKVIALNAIVDYYAVGKQWIEDQKVALSRDGSGRGKELKASRDALSKQFAAEWGPQGNTRKRLLEQYDQITSPLAQQIRDIFNANGSILPTFMNSAEKMNTIADINAYGAIVSDYLYTAVSEEMVTLVTYAQDLYAKELSGMNLILPELCLPEIEMPQMTSITSHVMKKCQSAHMRGLLVGGAIGSIVAIMTGGIGIPAVLAVGGGYLIGGGSGWNEVAQGDIQQAQSKLKTHIVNCMRQIQHSLTSIDIRNGQRKSFIQEYLDKIKTLFINNMEATYREQKQRLETECAKLSEQLALEGEELAKQQSCIENALVQWNKFDDELKPIAQELKVFQEKNHF